MPFTVPDGYFEGLTARVMASIPAEGSSSTPSAVQNTKVVGLLPRKKKNSWVKWVAAAACVCGAFLFIANQGSDTDQGQQLANVKPGTPISVSTSDEPEVGSLDEQSVPASKVYANNAYDLSSHVRRSATPTPANITPQPVIRTASRPMTTPSVETSSPRTASTEPATRTSSATKVSTPAVQSAVLAVNTPSSSASTSVDAYSSEYDMLDYTNMSGTEVYDYLAGNEYY